MAVQGWSRDSSLAKAAQEALNLDPVPSVLQKLAGQWSIAQWDELPSIELLSDEAMPGAAGAYAINSGTICLSQSWLESASNEQVQAVLTEELGHHLDVLLNAVDTAGNEGEAFARLLLSASAIEQAKPDDQIEIQVDNHLVAVEAAEITEPPSQPDLIEDSNSGVSDRDNVSNTDRPTFRGTADPGNAVELFADGLSIGSTTADSSGNWTYSIPEGSALGDGSYAITAIARNEVEPATVQRAPNTVASPDRTYQEKVNGFAFAALREDGSVVSWGQKSYGGDSSAVSDALQSGVVSFADPCDDDRLIPATPGSGLSSDSCPALAIMTDTTAPLFTSDTSAAVIDENSGSGQVVYTAAATDTSDITYSLKSDNNDDAESLSSDSITGVVRLTAYPECESQASYAFTVVAVDAAGNSEEQEVTLAINDLSEILHNHLPSGELLITGLLRPGATITLDASTIADEDGIYSGFTYSWQVFDGDTDT